MGGQSTEDYIVMNHEGSEPTSEVSWEPDTGPPRIAGITRRGFVGAGIVSAAAAAVLRSDAGSDEQRAISGTAARPGTRNRRKQQWSDLFGANPGRVVIDDRVELDVDAHVDEILITPRGRLVMAPDRSLRLTSSGNIVVFGTLVMRPQSSGQRHEIRFVDIDESEYVGGGMRIAESDVGLWVTQRGRFVARGAKKTPWTRATGDLYARTSTLQVANAAGWEPGDRIVVTPTTPPSPDNDDFHQDSDHAQTYDEAVIRSIDGNRIRLDKPLKHDHPTISFTEWNGTARTLGAEVLNLTRNVRIKGTRGGRGHVMFLHTTRRQRLRSVAFDLLGPRRTYAGKNGDRSDGVSGRYPLHFHHCGDGSRGTIVKDCVVTRSGNRAFVPHESHGITLRGCIAHDVRATAFWWDQPGRHNPTGEDPKTHDSLWVRCVASKVWGTTDSDDRYRLAGFNLSGGEHNTNRLLRSVAVGIATGRVTDNTSKPSGFHWTEHGQAVWQFRNCLAHNIGGSGILTWQNDEEVHIVDRFTAYHCGAHGIEHGAYSNFYDYRRSTLVANRMSGIAPHAVTRRTNSVRRRWTDQGLPAPILRFSDIRIEGQGLTRHGIRGLTHKFAAEQPDGETLLENIHVLGCTDADLFERDMKNASFYVLRDCQFDGRAFLLDSDAAADLRIDVRSLDGTDDSFTLRPLRHGGGTVVPEWNARRFPLGT